MKSFLLPLLLAGIAATPAHASQDQDARALEALVSDPEMAHEKYGSGTLKLDGCFAEAVYGSTTTRFHVGLLDYDNWSTRLDRGRSAMTAPATAEAYARADAWRGQIGEVWLPGGICPVGESEETLREFDRLFREGMARGHQAMINGEGGEFLRLNQRIKTEYNDGVPEVYEIVPFAGVIWSFREDRIEEFYEALRRYAEAYCLPAPDFD
jgi:hypothetical protein